MKTTSERTNERVSHEIDNLLNVLDRLAAAVRDRGLLPPDRGPLSADPARYVSADELLTTARAIWTRAYHPPKHEREEAP